MFRLKIFSLFMSILLVISFASPVFADSPGHFTLTFPEPYVDEFSGYFSVWDGNAFITTYAWTFLPYGQLSGEFTNSSPYVDITYDDSLGQLRFDLLPGLTSSTNFIMYIFHSDLEGNYTQMLMSDYITVVGGETLYYPSGTPIAVCFKGPCAFLSAEYRNFSVLDLTFSADSNLEYDVELFYNYYREIMAIYMPAVQAAVADINDIELTADALVAYQSDILSELAAISTMVDLQLMSRDPDDDRTIRDILIELVEASGCEYSPSDLDSIEVSLDYIGSSIDYLVADNNVIISDLDEIVNMLGLIYGKMGSGGSSSGGSGYGYDYDIYNFLSGYGSWTDLETLLDYVSSWFFDTAYLEYFKPQFDRQNEFYATSEEYYQACQEFFDAYNASQVPDERLDYDDSENNSLDVFSIFNRIVIKPFRAFWSQISSVFTFDSGTHSSDSVVSDYLFSPSGLSGFNNLNDVDWSTLP